MRRALVVVVAAAGMMVLAQPTRADCQIIGCDRHCWRVPGGIRCQNHCRQRCLRPAPPTYVPRHEPTPQYQHAAPRIDPGDLALIGLILAGVIAVIAGVIGSATTSSTTSAIDKLEQSTESMLADADEYERRTADIRADIAQQEHDAFQQGRADADREWHERHGGRS